MYSHLNPSLSLSLSLPLSIKSSDQLPRSRLLYQSSDQLHGGSLTGSIAYPAANCMLSDNIYDYYNVSQGKITIPNVDDGEECQLTDVSNSWIPPNRTPFYRLRHYFPYNIITLYINIIRYSKSLLC